MTRVRTNTILYTISLSMFSLFNYMRSYNKIFELVPHNDWQGIPTTILSILLFLLILHLDFSKTPKTVGVIITKISELSLGIYLSSAIYDVFFYSKLNSMVMEAPKKLEYYFIIVPLVFLCSFITSGIVEVIYQNLLRRIKLIN